MSNPNRPSTASRVLNFIEEDSKGNLNLDSTMKRGVNFIREGNDKTIDVEGQHLINVDTADSIKKESSLIELKKEANNKYRDVIA